MLLKCELKLFKSQINTNTNKNGFLLPTKCVLGVEILILSFNLSISCWLKWIRHLSEKRWFSLLVKHKKISFTVKSFKYWLCTYSKVIRILPWDFFLMPLTFCPTYICHIRQNNVIKQYELLFNNSTPTQFEYRQNPFVLSNLMSSQSYDNTKKN